MDFVKKLLTKRYYTEGTCLQVHSQKEKELFDWVISNKDNMLPIMNLVDTIKSSKIDGKISKKDRSKCLVKFWNLMKILV